MTAENKADNEFNETLALIKNYNAELFAIWHAVAFNMKANRSDIADKINKIITKMTHDRNDLIAKHYHIEKYI